MIYVIGMMGFDFWSVGGCVLFAVVGGFLNQDVKDWGFFPFRGERGARATSGVCQMTRSRNATIRIPKTIAVRLSARSSDVSVVLVPIAGKDIRRVVPAFQFEKLPKLRICAFDLIPGCPTVVCQEKAAA